AFRYAYVHQCVSTVSVDSDATLDLVVTSTADLAALNNSPVAAPPKSRAVFGSVYEVTPNGRQTAANIWVGWEAFMDTVMAETRTDSSGHYVLCGLPREKIVGLFAAVAYGNVVYATVDSGADAMLDFEVTRK